jgi:8-oxo-dGTP pyrophosphatase MutT (NUDIX family)
VIIRHRSAALCIRGTEMLVIELQDPSSKTRFWSLPGGGIEPHESSEDAAVREVLEETGYEVILDTESQLNTRYQFHWDNKDYDCHTTWFLGSPGPSTPLPVEDADFLLGHMWTPVKDFAILFREHSDILNPVKSLLRYRN